MTPRQVPQGPASHGSEPPRSRAGVWFCRACVLSALPSAGHSAGRCTGGQGPPALGELRLVQERTYPCARAAPWIGLAHTGSVALSSVRFRNGRRVTQLVRLGTGPGASTPLPVLLGPNIRCRFSLACVEIRKMERSQHFLKKCKSYFRNQDLWAVLTSMCWSQCHTVSREVSPREGTGIPWAICTIFCESTIIAK